jgi:hypothetical protein
MLVLSIVCWYFVLNKRAREEYAKPLRDFYRFSKDFQDMFEGLGFAVALIGALFFSIFFVALLAMRIAN